MPESRGTGCTLGQKPTSVAHSWTVRSFYAPTDASDRALLLHRSGVSVCPRPYGQRLSYPNSRAPQQDFSSGQLVVPQPPPAANEIQEPFVREKEIDPAKYYPDGYHPDLLTEWPVDDDLVVPVEVLPDTLLQSMGESWGDREAYKRHIGELSAKDG